ncbi:MAG: TraR/DksA family transcriptional regulator [Gammaproteobacteria bacterium]|jgi:RNA polymerase-binding transcription factor DksA|nr:TraR/DksA family transcriptional regulator [Gammaproteobacteria bacterium]
MASVSNELRNDGLVEIRRHLLARREELQHRVERIAAGVGRGRPLDPDFEEQATERQNEEVVEALETAARFELARIAVALARMEQGEYGACARCGADIPLERLRVVPYADCCISCAELADS